MKIFVPTPEELAPKPVQPGVYKAIVSGYKLKNTQKGDPMINVEFTLSGEDVTGRKVYTNLIISETTLWKTLKVFKAITKQDVPSKEWAIDELINYITNGIINKDCLVRIEVKVEGDVVRNEVKEVISV